MPFHDEVDEHLSTVLAQDHFYSDRCIYKLQVSSFLQLRGCGSARKLEDHAG